MNISNFQIVSRCVDYCSRPVGWLLCKPLWTFPPESVDVDSAVASMPRQMRSAGLELVGTCLHVAAAVFSCIRATLLPTKVFHFVEGPWIHASTIAESVHI